MNLKAVFCGLICIIPLILSAGESSLPKMNQIHITVITNAPNT